MRELANLLNNLFKYGMEKFGKYYSSYRGFVYDNVDPDNMGRVQLLIPEIAGNKPYITWALPKGCFSGTTHDGKTYGTHILPQNGDLVWVEFQRGNPALPIWSFGYPGKGEKPMIPSLMGDNVYWFRTPGGNIVSINDTDNTIHATLSNGIGLEITDKTINLNGDIINLSGAGQSSVLGESLVQEYTETLKAIAKIQVMTPLGPSSIPVNALDFINQSTTLETSLLSKKVKLS